MKIFLMCRILISSDQVKDIDMKMVKNANIMGGMKEKN